MKSEIPKPLIIGAAVLVVIVLAVVGFSVLKGATGGEYSGETLVPKPWGGPPGGFKPGGAKGATAPKGAGGAQGGGQSSAN